MMPQTSRRLALAAAAVSTFLLFWLSLGVGIIGQDGDPANRMYLGVIAIGIFGSIFARLRSVGMARVLVTMALAQTVIAAYAILAGLGRPWSGALELALLNGFFVAAFLGTAWLFRRASRS